MLLSLFSVRPYSAACTVCCCLGMQKPRQREKRKEGKPRREADCDTLMSAHLMVSPLTSTQRGQT